MIGLDTNILVRYLAQDDPVQSPKAREILERRLTEKDPGEDPDHLCRVGLVMGDIRVTEDVFKKDLTLPHAKDLVIAGLELALERLIPRLVNETFDR